MSCALVVDLAGAVEQRVIIGQQPLQAPPVGGDLGLVVGLGRRAQSAGRGAARAGAASTITAAAKLNLKVISASARGRIHLIPYCRRRSPAKRRVTHRTGTRRLAKGGDGDWGSNSGIGGLSVHHALVRRLPAADFIYLADQANTPYGGRGGEEIVDLHPPAARPFLGSDAIWCPGLQHRRRRASAPPAADLAAGLSPGPGRPVKCAGHHRPEPSRPPRAFPGSTKAQRAPMTRSSGWMFWASFPPQPPSQPSL